MDPKIRDEALSDDPTQIKGRFSEIESFVGDPDELARYVIGGSDLSTLLKHYVQALYIDTSVTSGEVHITNYRGDIDDIPIEVPITVFLSNALIEPVGEARNKIVFKATEEGQTDVSFEIRKRELATGNFVPVDANDCSKYNIYTMYLSSQGFFVAGVFQEDNSYESINTRITTVEGKLAGVTVAGGVVNFGTQDIVADVATVNTNNATTSNVGTANVTALDVATSADFTGANTAVSTPTTNAQISNKEYVDTKVAASITAALSAKLIYGTALTPEQDPNASVAPVGTFYFRKKA